MTLNIFCNKKKTKTKKTIEFCHFRFSRAYHWFGFALASFQQIQFEILVNE